MVVAAGEMKLCSLSLQNTRKKETNKQTRPGPTFSLDAKNFAHFAIAGE
jgi:hypothetical protein